MGLKEEFDKLVESKRKKLEREAQERVDYAARAWEEAAPAREKFAPLIPILEKLESAVSDKYLEAKIFEEGAVLWVGPEWPSEYPDISWEIRPTPEGNESKKRYVV